MSQSKCKKLSHWFNRILHSHFSFYRGSPFLANKNVKHSKTAKGNMQTFHTYIISKPPSNESEHSIFIGWYQIYKIHTTGDFPLMGPLWWYRIHLGGSHLMEHICGNVYMGEILYKIMISELFFKLKKVRKKCHF